MKISTIFYSFHYATETLLDFLKIKAYIIKNINSTISAMVKALTLTIKLIVPPKFATNVDVVVAGVVSISVYERDL